ncbi:YihY family inner membrane protein [Myxococcota bacterium]|nr:YihY family inner membrane protein [Myxococcota bacterium]
MAEKSPIERLLSMFERAQRFVGEEMWSLKPEPKTATARALASLQFAVMVGEGFIKDRLLLRSSVLSYYTVLALIPIVALVVSIVAAVGVRSGDLAHLIVDQIAAGSPEAREQILDLVNKANFGGLGTLSAFALFFTAVFHLSSVERALNEICGVTRSRTWARRIPDYLAVMIVAPLLLGTALSLATTFRSQWMVQRLLEFPLFANAYSVGFEYAPSIVMSVVLAFLYWFLPNTRIRPTSALLGGVVAAVLVLAAQSLYLGLNIGVARYDALFGTFAALPLLFVWIYMFWAVILFGAEVTFAHQHLPLYRREIRGRIPGAAAREELGLRIALEVSKCFRDRLSAPSADELSELTDVPVRTIRGVLSNLRSAGVLSLREDEGRDECYQLGRPAEGIRVLDVLRGLRGEREPSGGDDAVRRLVGRVVVELEEGARKRAGGMTLADLLKEVPPALPSRSNGGVS